MDNYEKMTAALDTALGVDKSFDIQRRRLNTAGDFEVSFYSVAGLINDEISEKLLEYALRSFSPMRCVHDIPHHDVTLTEETDVLCAAVLTGKAVLVSEGCDKAAVIDVKSYPLRSVEEPENDKVLRGPRDGFGESLVRNTSLIRRRLRDPMLRIKRISVADPSVCDVALCYVETRADEKFVKNIENKLRSIKIKAVNMSQQSVAECLIKRGWLDPFPKIRYTERPDAAAAMLEEGSVIVICDNSPQAMILPTGIFDFLQQTDDFYFPPLAGTYLRITRMVIFLLSLLLTPIWYLLLKTPDDLPQWLQFININEPAAVPLFFQLLIAEFMIDGLKLASLNTPSMLSNSLSVVGGLILGDYAVQAGWFSSQTILYMAIVAIASFTQQSYELGYAFKFFRILLLVLTELLGLRGFVLGIIFTVGFIACNKTVDGSRGYLYPLIPFNGRALLRMFTRQKLSDRVLRDGHAEAKTQKKTVTGGQK